MSSCPTTIPTRSWGSFALTVSQGVLRSLSTSLLAGMQFVDDPERLALYEAVLPVQKRARPAPAPKA